LLKEKLREVLSSDNTRDPIEPLEQLLDRIIMELRPLGIIITRSLAERKFVRGLSDIDILVITDYKPGDKRFILTSVRDVDVEITVISTHELEKALQENREFYVNTLRQGIIVFTVETASYN
jgi:predicted nucleotidyltransferase